MSPAIISQHGGRSPQRSGERGERGRLVASFKVGDVTGHQNSAMCCSLGLVSGDFS
jgi:hypothetical protein